MQQRIEITVHYFAKLRDLTNKEQESFETEINSTPKDVYRKLNELYEGWFEVYDRSPTIVLNTDNLNYIEDLEHLIDVRKAIEKFL